MTTRHVTFRARRQALDTIGVKGAATLLAALSTALYIGAPAAFDRFHLLLCSTTTIATIATLVTNKWRMGRSTNWFSPELLFAASYTLVHLVPPSVTLLLPDSQLAHAATNPDILNEAAALSCAGLAFFALGFMLVPNRVPAPRTFQPRVAVLNGLTAVGRVLFAAGFACATIYLTVLGDTLVDRAYSGSAIGSHGDRTLYGIMRMLISTGFVLLCVATVHQRNRPTRRWWLIACVLAFPAWLFILGDRSSAARFVILALAAATTLFRPFSAKHLLLLLLAGLVLISVGRVGRGSDRRTAASFAQRVLSERDRVGLEDSLLNIAASTNVLYTALETVPSQYPYFMGDLKKAELIGVLPFGRQLLPVRDLRLSNSAWFLTWVTYGSLEIGVGTTIVADLYVDFGPVGVLTTLLLLGVLTASASRHAHRRASPARIAYYVFLVSVLTMMPRYGVATLVRGVLWPTAFVYFLLCVLNRTKTRHSLAEIRRGHDTA